MGTVVRICVDLYNGGNDGRWRRVSIIQFLFIPKIALVSVFSFYFLFFAFFVAADVLTLCWFIFLVGECGIHAMDKIA